MTWLTFRSALIGEIAAVHSRLFPGQGVVTCTALRTDDNRESTQPGYFIWDQYDATGELSASPLPAARRQASCLTWRCRFLESGLDTDFTATLSLCMLRALHRSPSLPVCGYGNSGQRRHRALWLGLLVLRHSARYALQGAVPVASQC